MSLATDVAAGVDAAFTALDDLKQTVQVRRATPGAYSTQTHTFSESTADTPFTAAVTSEKVERDESGRVIRRVRTLVMKPGAITPTIDDHVVIGSDVCKIASANPIKPGSAVLAWEIEAVS